MGKNWKMLADKLAKNHNLEAEELLWLYLNRNKERNQYLYETARKVREEIYGKEIYIRGLIEISNYCRNDCYYCGIRRSNQKVRRYRLSESQILDCCRKGYALGFYTFVLQGGEDGYYTDERLAKIISSIKREFPDCAVTLSLGERSRESYQRLYDAGADRYLLRHETADCRHYRKLHPKELSLEHRMQCLEELKEIGYQTGAGFMVGSPGQTPECLIKDFCYLKKLAPEMVGIGPFLSHKDTPFRDCENGTLEDTLFCLAVVRLLLPQVLLPATTALGTVDPTGRKKGILAGANVVMPNLSPQSVREDYLLYDHKASTGVESAEGLKELEKEMESVGFQVVKARGDWKQK